MTTTFERRNALLRILAEQPGTRTAELASLLDVSVGTVRNDLNALQRQGRIRRNWGGAEVIEETNRKRDEVPNQASKARIAKRAAEMIEDGDAIWLDAGTTVQMMIPLLEAFEELTIITNGLKIAQEMGEMSKHRTILIGGMVGKDGLYTQGTGSEAQLNTVNIRTAFVSGTGFTIESGLTVSEYENAQLKNRVIESAERVVALVDSTKIGRRGFAPIAQIGQLTHLVTDRDLSAGMLRRLSQIQVNVIICGRRTIRSHTHTTQGGKKKYVIGFANQTEKALFAVDVRRGLERAVTEIAHFDVDLVITDNKLSSAEALRVANHLIEREVDLAIEYQIDHHSGNLIMDKFQRANIPVIAVDIPMIGATYFGVDNYRSGLMAGEALGRWIERFWYGTLDRLIILDETRAGELPRARIQGQIDGLQAHIGTLPEESFIVLNSGNTLTISQTNVREALQAIPTGSQIAVLSFNDEAAVGAIEAARELGREKEIVVVGQGGDRLGRAELRRRESPLIGTTAYMPEQYGRRLLELAINILQGGSVPPANYTEHIFLTPDNIDQYYD